MSIHLFQYDIPEIRIYRPNGTSYSRAVMPNPSARLWRAGAVRITLSCWLVRDGAVPNGLVTDFGRFGVAWETAPFDPSAAESLIKMAVRSVRKEVQEYVARGQETATREAARLASAESGAVSPEEDAAAHKRYRTQLAAVARRVRNCLQRVQTAAAGFGIQPHEINVPQARAALEGIKAGMTARAAAYARAHDIIVKRNGKNDPVAKSMAADDIFGPIAADYVEELDTPEAVSAAAQLRAAFAAFDE